jgi:hypothetical protein
MIHIKQSINQVIYRKKKIFSIITGGYHRMIQAYRKKKVFSITTDEYYRMIRVQMTVKTMNMSKEV